MTRKERYEYILKYFREQMPEVQTELEFGSVFQLLVAVILSAQCTDKRINQVTPELFRHYPDAKTMAKAKTEDVLEYISSDFSRGRVERAYIVCMLLDVLNSGKRQRLLEVIHKLRNRDERSAVEAFVVSRPFVLEDDMTSLLVDVSRRVVTVRTRDDESETVFLYLLLMQRMRECPAQNVLEFKTNL